MADVNGLSFIPLKMPGSAMSRIDEFTDARRAPIVVFDSAIHL
jgi:hypothetical protein